MTSDREQDRIRCEILSAYISVIDRWGELFKICATTDDMTAARLAVEGHFGLSSVAADAVLSLQVRRFTPFERGRIQDELTALEAALA